MTDQEAAELVALPGKIVVRPFVWGIQASGHTPKIHLFESAVQVGKKVLEGVVVRASYRGSKVVRRGDAEAVIPEKFDCALFLGVNRIAAIDTNPGQRHFNKVGIGLPYFNQVITAYSHRHLWAGSYGYAEPIEPPLLDVVQLINVFSQECKLSFRGSLEHPLRGEQGDLL